MPLSWLSRLTMITFDRRHFCAGRLSAAGPECAQPTGRAHHHFHVPLGENHRRALGMFGLLQHFFHPTQCYALCAVARSGAHLLTGALQASHLAGRPLQYFHDAARPKICGSLRSGCGAEFHPISCAASSRAPRPQMVFLVSGSILGCGPSGLPSSRVGTIWARRRSRKGTFFMPRSPDCAASS